MRSRSSSKFESSLLAGLNLLIILVVGIIGFYSMIAIGVLSVVVFMLGYEVKLVVALTMVVVFALFTLLGVWVVLLGKEVQKRPLYGEETLKGLEESYDGGLLGTKEQLIERLLTGLLYYCKQKEKQQEEVVKDVDEFGISMGEDTGVGSAVQGEIEFSGKQD